MSLDQMIILAKERVTETPKNKPADNEELARIKKWQPEKGK